MRCVRPVATPAAPARLRAGARMRRSADRLDRRRAVAAREQPADRMHHRQRRRARREGEQHRTCRCAPPGRASTRTDIAAPVVDQRVHRDDVVETAQRGVQHVADAEFDRARAEIARQRVRAPGRPAWATGRSRRPARRAAPPPPPARRCRSRHPARARPRRSCRQPAEQRARASRRGRRAPSRGCG